MRRLGVGVFSMPISYKRVNSPTSRPSLPLIGSLDSESACRSRAVSQGGGTSRTTTSRRATRRDASPLGCETSLVIDGESVEPEAGDAVWILPTATRQLRNGEDETASVLVSVPASTCRITTSVDEPKSWATNGFSG